MNRIILEHQNVLDNDKYSYLPTLKNLEDKPKKPFLLIVQELTLIVTPTQTII